MTFPSDALAMFCETSALRWQTDRTYREQLTREGTPRIEETLTRSRRKTA